MSIYMKIRRNTEFELDKTEQIIPSRVAPDNYVPIENDEQISSYSI